MLCYCFNGVVNSGIHNINPIEFKAFSVCKSEDAQVCSNEFSSRLELYLLYERTLLLSFTLSETVLEALESHIVYSHAKYIQ